jgi:hypothetical protein
MPAGEEHHPLVQLASAAIQAFVCEGRTLTPAEVQCEVTGSPAGVFVTLRFRSNGELRGCIGTIQATEPTLAAETIQNAISSAAHDPRFPPVRPEELPELEIEVSVLHRAEKISSLEQLDPRRYGVIVQHGRRRGLLLPDIEGIDDAVTQVEIARQKAWIAPDQPLEMFRFQVDKYR